MARERDQRAKSASGKSREAALDTTLTIETPEHVAFSYLLAGPAVRIAAYLLDLLMRSLLIGAVLIVLATTSQTLPGLEGLGVGALLVAFFALEWGYFVVSERVMGGSSLGKRAFRLRVISMSGKPVTMAESILRNLLRAADLLPFSYALGISTMVFDRSFRRLGDLVAGTVVVHEPRTKPQGQKRQNTPPSALPLPARIELSREERAALALFRDRLAHISVARGSELAELVAPAYRKRFRLPEADGVELLLALEASAR